MTERDEFYAGVYLNTSTIRLKRSLGDLYSEISGRGGEVTYSPEEMDGLRESISHLLRWICKVEK